jgi:hypothetical protein
LHELKRRFAAIHCDVLRGIQAMSPFSDIFGEFNIVSTTFAAAYGADLDELSHELHQTKHVLQKMKIEDRPTTMARFISHRPY